MAEDLNRISVSLKHSLRECITCLNSGGKGIALVVDEDQRLLGTITDGDIRRAILANIGLDEPVSVLLDQKARTRYAQPVTAPTGTDRGTLLELFRQWKIVHIPLVDGEGRVVDMATLDQLVPKQTLPQTLPMEAVVMAGGFGTRLRPLTEDMPKAMLPVGDRPLMEIIVQQLRDAGIQRVHLTVHHQSEKITDHFGDGRKFGVDMTYVAEDRPLGTAGALGLMDPPKETMLVINGDILTQVDFQQMLEFHREHGADLTVAVQQYQLQVPYGVIECDGPAVKSLTEKPQLNFFINAGIYMLEPVVHRLIPEGERYDMTDLIQRVMDEGRQVVAFPIHEYWIDIGQHSDYQQAQEHVENRRSSP